MKLLDVFNETTQQGRLYYFGDETLYPGGPRQYSGSIDARLMVALWTACSRGDHGAEEALDDQWQHEEVPMLNGTPKECTKYLHDLQMNGVAHDTHEHLAWAVGYDPKQTKKAFQAEVGRWKDR